MSETVKPILEGVLEAAPAPRLLGGFCDRCDRRYFPAPSLCPYCLKPVQSIRLSPEGTIHSFTVIRTKAPFGLPEPYAVGYVDLEEDGLRIFSLLDWRKIEQLHTGGRVTLRIEPVGFDGQKQPRLRYFFSPSSG